MNSLILTEDLDANHIEEILNRAQLFVDGLIAPKLEGVISNIFFEPSTRTFLSFQIAAYKLGLHSLEFVTDHSSLLKGESFRSTLKTLEALGVDVAIIRHKADWTELLCNFKTNMSIINAGSGVKEHPTQALLDALTIRQEFGSLKGLNILIAGDIRHSRVARSNITMLTRMGAKVELSTPKMFYSSDILNIPWVEIDKGIEYADVLILLRIQKERHDTIYDFDFYHKNFGLTEERLLRLNKGAIILHPGPINIGIEICNKALNDPRCRILKQVSNGVPIRMAVLEKCLGGLS